MSCSSSRLRRPFARARLAASAASTASWHVKALVEATPISGPAWVGRRRSASRAIELVGTLTTTAMRCRSDRAWRSAASVSAVSPDRLAIAKLARDVDVDGHAGEALDPIFRDEPGIVAGPAGDDRQAVDAFKIHI